MNMLIRMFLKQICFLLVIPNVKEKCILWGELVCES